MKLIKKVSVGMIVGAIMGQLFGVLLVFAFAPRHWVTTQWVMSVSPQGTVAGAIGGVVISVLLWALSKRIASERIGRTLNQVPPRKATQVFWGMISGSVLGCIGGMVIEVVIDVGRLIVSTGGIHFLVSDFSPVLYGGPVLGIIAGGLYGYIRGLAQKAISRMIRGVYSGIILGVSAGVFWIVSTCWWIPLNNSSQIAGYGYMTTEVAIGAAIFGITVGTVAEMVLAYRVLAGNNDLPIGDTHNASGEKVRTSN